METFIPLAVGAVYKVIALIVPPSCECGETLWQASLQLGFYAAASHHVSPNGRSSTLKDQALRS
jgi:hypothetical protein